MTPKSIETGRRLDATAYNVTTSDSAPTLLARADAARVALAVAVWYGGFPSGNQIAAIGVMVDGTVVPLTTLTPGHPVCYLSVDKIGSLVMQDIYCQHVMDGGFILGVSTIRQNQPLE